MPKKKIYTHDEAMLIVELFENVLSKYEINVPSEEDEERGEGDAGLYGSTYSDLLDNVEDLLIALVKRCNGNSEIVEGVFSGAV
jgi:hypothetical protein